MPHVTAGTRARRSLWAAVVLAAAAVVPMAPAGHATPRTPAGKATASTDTITVATYNVCKTTCGKGDRTWDGRRTKVARIITDLNADVVLVQEASTLPYRGTTQWADLAGLLADRGMPVASMKDGCTDFCTRGAHVFFNSTTIEPLTGIIGPTNDPAPPEACMPYWQRRNELRPTHNNPFYAQWWSNDCRKYMAWEPQEDMSAGMASQQQLSGIPWGPIKDRNVSWAFLRQKSTGRVFLAISVHLPKEQTDLGEQARRRVAAELPRWAAKMSSDLGHPGIPVLLGGDLNSYDVRQPNGAQTILARSGMVDAFKADVRVNVRFSTVNQNGSSNARFAGWPPSPHKYNRPATRIDYVFASGLRPLRHEVYLRLRDDGRFDEAFRASDHNPVITKWAFA